MSVFTNAAILQNVVQNFDLVLRVTMAVQDGESGEDLVVDLLFGLGVLRLRILEVGTLQDFDEL